MVDRPMIWRILRHYGIPQKINIIQSFYEGNSCRIIHNTDLSAPFNVKIGVSGQRCILSPLIFSLVIDWVLKAAMDQPRGIRWTLMQKTWLMM